MGNAVATIIPAITVPETPSLFIANFGILIYHSSASLAGDNAM